MPMITQKKEDMRITKSKRDMRNALVELLKTTPFEKITVTDICKQAMVNKMTFYKHYQDKYTLFEDCIRNFANEVYATSFGINEVDQAFISDPVGTCTRIIVNSLKACNDRKEVINSFVYGSNTTLRFIVDKCIGEIITEIIDKIASVVKFKYPTEILSDFVVGGFEKVFARCIFTGALKIEDFENYVHEFFTDLVTNDVIVLKSE